MAVGKPFQKGNKMGRKLKGKPRKFTREARELARMAMGGEPGALKKMQEWWNSDDFKKVELVLHYAFGKPTQNIKGEGGFELLVTRVYDDEPSQN
jgi:hypothetical protein